MSDVQSPMNSPMQTLWDIGIAPLFSGLGFFLLGMSSLLKRFIPQTSLAQNSMRWTMLLITAAALAAAAIWVRRSMNSGLFTPPGRRENVMGRAWLLLPMVVVPMVLVSLVIALGFTSYGHHPSPYMIDKDRLIMPAFAVLFAILSFYYGWKREVSLLHAFGIYLACLAVLVWWLPLSPVERGGLVMSASGGPLAIYGAVRLRALSPPSLHSQTP